MGKVNIGPHSIVSLVLILVFATVLLSVAKSTIPTASNAYYDLATTYNSTVMGTDASNFATNTPGYLGWYF